jgi:D-sedoheptulose 7-phosphate isomerase
LTDYIPHIDAYLAKEIEVLNALDRGAISDAMNLLAEAFEAEKTIYIFGNGGSAATASHYQNDFNKGISEWTKKKFRFSCLNDNVPTVLAIANDIGYSEVYSFQLRGRLAPGDIAIGISGSGNSPNIVSAAEYAKQQGNRVIGITGFDGGRLAALADISLNVPVNSMQIAEDVHMIFDHLMMAIFCKTLAGIEHLKQVGL